METEVQVALIGAIVAPFVVFLIQRLGKQAKDRPDTRNGMMETMQWLRDELREKTAALIKCQTDCEREKAELRHRMSGGMK